MELRLPHLALFGGAAAFAISVAAAQAAQPAPDPGFAAPPYTNLKVLPATLTRDQLLWNMRFFSQSLGVQCTHCHVGGNDQQFDFASDAKPAKLTARKMLQMVHRINREDFGITEFRNVKVTCFTCHRGALKPATFPPEPAAAAPRPERG